MSTTPDVSAARAQDLARTAGRGVLYITFAKLFFIASHEKQEQITWT